MIVFNPCDPFHMWGKKGKPVVSWYIYYSSLITNQLDSIDCGGLFNYLRHIRKTLDMGSPKSLFNEAKTGVRGKIGVTHNHK